MHCLIRPTLVTVFTLITLGLSPAQERTHPRLMADRTEIDVARTWIRDHAWYREIFEEHRRVIDRFLAHRPIYVSPLKQTYQYRMYMCPKHDVELLYEMFRPFEHRCRVDTTEVYRNHPYDMAWAGWYNRILANHLVWMGLLYNVYGEEEYAAAGKEILMKFADLYLDYPTENTILGPAHVFFGTLSESFWGVDMAYGYDLLYHYPGFTEQDRRILKDSLFYPLALITQQFPESASNRQLWYNNVSAAVGFLYGDQELIDFALKGTYGFEWQLGSALPESGFWAEWSGYHFVALRGMIHLAEMARHNGYDLYHLEIAGRSMKKMFDAPFLLIKPNFEFPRLKDSGGGSLQEYAPFYEVGYAVYGDPKYRALLKMTGLQRGTQIVGETSALGRAPEPVSMFRLVPDLIGDTLALYPHVSVNMEGNGFAVLRHGSGDDRTYLYLDYGIMGGEHGHPDRLQIGYYANGRNWIVDPLNESYQHPNLQLWYRQTIAHNTLVVDQTSQTWTNGYGRFFGTLPSLQVASGGSTTAYPGVTLTRTLVDLGDCFVDLFDAASDDVRTYDLPLHGFGTVAVHDVVMHPEPIDRFGNRPGIPGYDQLTGIHSGITGATWKGEFTDKGKMLSLTMLGESATEVFRAMTPPIGGFYKQMVQEQVPLPMIMCRRTTDSTRFVSLIQAYPSAPPVTSFSRGDARDTYILRRARSLDYLTADIEHSVYSLVREVADTLTTVAGFHLKEVRRGAATLLSSPTVLSAVQCTWTDRTLHVWIPGSFVRVKVYAPQATAVTLNGSPAVFSRNGDFVVLTQTERLVVQAAAPRDSLLFAGMRNTLRVTVANPTPNAVTGAVRVTLAPDWRLRVRSQLTWWGGIVNLIATNKGPLERTVHPAAFREDAGWIDGTTSASGSIPPGGSREFTLSLDVPGDAPPVTLPALVSFGPETLRTSLVITPPVTARMMVPNRRGNEFVVRLHNHTDARLSISTHLLPGPDWQTTKPLRGTTAFRPGESRHLVFPVTLARHTSPAQRYPVRLDVTTEKYTAGIVRDVYVSTAHFAFSPPSLDGSWKGWNRSTPSRICTADQIGKLLFGNQPWRGESDLSAQIFVMYDDTYLYVGADVTDDSLVTHWDFPRMSYPWDTDCMEVILDVRTNAGQGADPPTPGLYRHLSLAEYRQTDFAAEAWQGAGAGGPLLPKPNLVDGAETFFRRTPRGYALITRYPFTRLDGLVPRPGMKIGFDVGINDNDGTNYRGNLHIWAGYTQNQSWWDVGTIGALVFGPKP